MRLSIGIHRFDAGSESDVDLAGADCKEGITNREAGTGAGVLHAMRRSALAWRALQEKCRRVAGLVAAEADRPDPSLVDAAVPMFAGPTRHLAPCLVEKGLGCLRPVAEPRHPGCDH